MATDYPVRRRSNEEIRKDAIGYHKTFRDERREMVDILCEIESGWVDTIYGRKELEIEVVDDAEMEEKDAETRTYDTCIRMRFKRSVYDALKKYGDGRARFTAAHELAHARLGHDKAPMARGTGVNSASARPKFIAASESAEHQANEWASYYLLSDQIVGKYKTIKELAINCGLSIQAAKIRFERFAQAKDRSAAAERVRKMAEAFKLEVSRPHYTTIACNRCGQKTLIPMGIKYRCSTCKAVAENFQDGDRSDV